MYHLQVSRRRPHFLTCFANTSLRIRRVKCDEGKPFCKRCTSTGRKCDGYAAPGQPSLTARNSSPKPERPSVITDPMEQRMLLFFNTVTAPALSGDFSSDFWERRVIQASAAEPTSEHKSFIQNLLMKFCHPLAVK